jgi:hypothetical protein
MTVFGISSTAFLTKIDNYAIFALDSLHASMVQSAPLRYADLLKDRKL